MVVFEIDLRAVQSRTGKYQDPLTRGNVGAREYAFAVLKTVLDVIFYGHALDTAGLEHDMIQDRKAILETWGARTAGT